MTFWNQSKIEDGNLAYTIDPNTVPFADASARPAVRGLLHRPHTPSGEALILAHSAGSNCEAPLLVAVAEAFAEAGFAVLRCDLPFRQNRPHGPPFPGSAKEDREGLKNAVNALRKLEPGNLRRVFLGGHSYGGRQATMIAAETPDLVDGLLLLSYPLHPPRQPLQLRTAHFPKLHARALFFHGTRDGFGSMEELESALRLIPAPTRLVAVEGAGHDLSLSRRSRSPGAELAGSVVSAFREFFA